MVAAGIAIDPTARFLLTTLIGGVVACVFGILIGIPALRLHGDYLAIITLGFGEIIRVIIQNLKVAGGMGLDKGAAGQALIGIERTANLYVVFWIMVVTVVVLFMFGRSRYGRAVKAIRDDEIAAGASGLNTTYLKVLVFAISAFFAGIAGGIFAQYIGSLNPTMAGWLNSINYVIMVVFGGMGSLTGSIVSAIGLTILPELLRAFADYRMLAYSVVLVLVMIFRPQGIFGSWEFSLPRLVNRMLFRGAAGMNPTETEDLLHCINTIRDRFGIAILLIEHDMSLVMSVCQRIQVLDYGRTIASGTPEEIANNPQVISAYLGSDNNDDADGDSTTKAEPEPSIAKTLTEGAR